MSERDEHDRALKVLRRTADMFRDAGVPDHAIPPALADHLVMVTLALGSSNGLADQAVRAILLRMENMLQDWRLGNPPFEEFNGRDEDTGGFLAEEFLRTMVRFVMWFLGTLDEAFVEKILKGGTQEEAAKAIVQDACRCVQGNRSPESQFTAADVGMIMDKLAAMHLEVRHGPNALQILRGGGDEKDGD